MKDCIVSIMETKDIKIGLVIMASGLGKRFGGNKLMAELDNKPLVKWIIDLTEGFFDRRIVVTRSTDVKALCDSLNIQSILHELPNRNDTVRLGLSAIREEIDYCFFVPGDQPLLSRETISKLILSARENKEKIVRTSFSDVVGSPMGFPQRYFDELLKLPEGKGGNWIAKSNPTNICYIETEEDYELWDIDTVADLELIRNIWDEKNENQ